MREKLIELLETVVSPNELLCYGEVLVSTSRVADHLIANGVTIQKWIPVTERLPEDINDRVLVLTNERYPYRPIGNQPIDTDRYRGEYGKWVRYGDKVTHWMPLPEPPNEG